MSGHLVWTDNSYTAHRLELAIAESKSAILRLQGMKARAQVAPQVAVGKFPYPARTCAEWLAP